MIDPKVVEALVAARSRATPSPLERLTPREREVLSLLAAFPSGLASPACSAIVQQFLRGRSARSPSTNALARRRGSTRPNRPATRPSNSSSPACQRAGSTSRLWPAATV
jgi:hypothetical protein